MFFKEKENNNAGEADIYGSPCRRSQQPYGSGQIRSYNRGKNIP